MKPRAIEKVAKMLANPQTFGALRYAVQTAIKHRQRLQPLSTSLLFGAFCGTVLYGSQELKKRFSGGL